MRHDTAAAEDTAGPGPLAGVRVIEIAGMGPAPHAAMTMADLGADVVLIERPSTPGVVPTVRPAQQRGRTLVEADLKNPDDIEEILRLAERADVLIEGFRPGVTERLGIGPQVALDRNPRLIYGRVTGWGQTGPRAQQAGHDLNYISVTGLLHAVGRAGERPVPPLNLFGDFGGGSMYLVVGVLAALIERQHSGRGQVIDAAMVNGAPALGHLLWSMRAAGRWSDERGTNVFDGSAPFYDTYECADGQYVAVGALEPQFYAELLRALDIAPETLGPQRDPQGWPHMRAMFSERFASRPRDDWAKLFATLDACVTPVLSFAEAEADDHMTARSVFIDVDGAIQPAPAPSFSRTPPNLPSPPPRRPVDITTLWA
ncbi:CoA transferase [Nocardia sp. NBC_00565]|uniref:CaiB/BaiF CoA transferase family protein n=1 Tax=Nocardia sp. NBC_00565 TaxID=2975993 RepID=UPI002E7FEF92|nr:CaiB/BaiF CoA-transferase family protein [Nocardia sp. NBC_00565]WUC07852.1 CoA transferase [Nocardia sp. NBC_00565]